jgi:hypothetical protein
MTAHCLYGYPLKYWEEGSVQEDTILNAFCEDEEIELTYKESKQAQEIWEQHLNDNLVAIKLKSQQGGWEL